MLRRYLSLYFYRGFTVNTAATNTVSTVHRPRCVGLHTMKSRIAYMYHSWYDPRIRMTSEEYVYILYLSTICWLAWGLGLIIGLIWSLVL